MTIRADADILVSAFFMCILNLPNKKYFLYSSLLDGETNNLITMKKYCLLLGLILLLLVVGIKAQAEVTLAIIAPKTGEFVKAGNELFEGARLAVKEINDNGGINGQKLDLLTIDDRCDDRLAISTAEMLSLLKSKSIGLVVGPYCSNRFDDIARIYEKSKIFQIIPTTEAFQSGSMDKQGQILLLGTKAEMSKDFFQFYNANFAGLKVGFVYDDNPNNGYAEVAKSLNDAFRRYGKANLLKFYALNGGSGISDIVEKIAVDDVHVVFVLGARDDVSSFIVLMRQKDEQAMIFSAKKMINEEVPEILEGNTKGIYVLSLPGLKDSLLFTESLVNLRLLGLEPEGLETYSYMAIKLWYDLAKQVKSFNYQKLLAVANGDDMKEKWSDFLAHSGSLGSIKYIIEEYDGDSFKQVY